MYDPKDYEPCGEALKINSDIRIRHNKCSVPAPYKNWGKLDGKYQLEKSVGLNGGIDTYKYVRLVVVKNKMGGMPEGSKINQRVWVSDGDGVARGLDPVFDLWQYFLLTGQLKGNSLKSFKLNLKKSLKDNPLNGKEMSLRELKIFVIGELEVMKKAAKKLGVDCNPNILKAAKEQLASGEGYQLLNEASNGE